MDSMRFIQFTLCDPVNRTKNHVFVEIDGSSHRDTIVAAALIAVEKSSSIPSSLLQHFVASKCTGVLFLINDAGEKIELPSELTFSMIDSGCRTRSLLFELPASSVSSALSGTPSFPPGFLTGYRDKFPVDLDAWFSLDNSNKKNLMRAVRALVEKLNLKFYKNQLIDNLRVHLQLLGEVLFTLDGHVSSVINLVSMPPTLRQLLHDSDFVFNVTWKKKESKVTRPRLSQTTVHGLCARLCEKVEAMPSSWPKHLRSVTTEVAGFLDKLGTAMKQQTEAAKSRQVETLAETVARQRTPTVVLLSRRPLLSLTSRKLTPVEQRLSDLLLNRAMYESLSVNELSLSTRARLQVLDQEHFLLSCFAARVSFPGLGGERKPLFLLRVDPNSPSHVIDLSTVVAKLVQEAPVYHQRWQRAQALRDASIISSFKTGVFEALYSRLTGDRAQLQSRPGRVLLAQCTMDVEDEDNLVADLRALTKNGSSFDCYWEIVQRFLDNELLAAEERRHSQQLFLPAATSVRGLMAAVQEDIDQMMICGDLKEQPAVPSPSWFAYQFLPPSRRSAAAQHYTSRFQVRLKVQSRSAHQKHVDVHYGNALLKYAREFCIRFREHCAFFSLDDKCKIKLGEPGFATAAVVRQKRVPQLISDAGPATSAADHDHNASRCRIVPSVILSVDIPDGTSSTSFHSGQAYFSLKDGVFEPSTAAGHMVELINVVEDQYGTFDEPVPPVVCLCTDGGGDHRTTFVSVKLSLIALFKALDLDFLIAVRPAPGQSYVNPAERVMASLNLGLYGVALAREKHPDDSVETRFSGCKSMKELRDQCSAQEVQEIIKPAVDVVRGRFQNQTYAGRSLLPVEKSTAGQREQLLAHLHKLLPENIENASSLSDKELFTTLNCWTDSHCRFRRYSVQIKRCNDEQCCGAWRKPADVELDWLPDVVPDPDRADHYLPFAKAFEEKARDELQVHVPSIISGAYGAGRPLSSRSSQFVNREDEVDRQRRNKNKHAFAERSVVSVLYCANCEKARLIYASRLISKEKGEIDPVRSVLEEAQGVWTCGEPITSLGERFCDLIYYKGQQKKETQKQTNATAAATATTTTTTSSWSPSIVNANASR